MPGDDDDRYDGLREISLRMGLFDRKSFVTTRTHVSPARLLQPIHQLCSANVIVPRIWSIFEFFCLQRDISAWSCVNANNFKCRSLWTIYVKVVGFSRFYFQLRNLRVLNLDRSSVFFFSKVSVFGFRITYILLNWFFHFTEVWVVEVINSCHIRRFDSIWFVLLRRVFIKP